MSPLNVVRPRKRFAAALIVASGLLTAAITATACSPGLLALLYVINKEQTQNANNNANSNAIDSRCPPPEAGDAPATISYADDVKPLLQSKGCLSSGCHGGSFPSSGYSLRDYNPSFGPGDDAEVLGVCEIVSGDASASFILEKLRPDAREGARMPLLREPLSEEEIAIIEIWINEGAQNN